MTSSSCQVYYTILLSDNTDTDAIQLPLLTVWSWTSPSQRTTWWCRGRCLDWRVHDTGLYRHTHRHMHTHTAPVYLADECTLVTTAGSRPLRSADNRTFLVKRSRNQFGDCCFATVGPTLWSNLPEQLRQLDITFGQFKLSLKKFVW